jgi:hypothetical protein
MVEGAVLWRLRAENVSLTKLKRGEDREEAACWLGRAMHRKNPWRVLAAVRLLLSARIELLSREIRT